MSRVPANTVRNWLSWRATRPGLAFVATVLIAAWLAVTANASAAPVERVAGHSVGVDVHRDVPPANDAPSPSDPSAEPSGQLVDTGEEVGNVVSLVIALLIIGTGLLLLLGRRRRDSKAESKADLNADSNADPGAVR
jgi:LPXTG-motif cell wall-anchored protein